MKFSQPDANLFLPAGNDAEKALASTTHLGIGAHADDLEILAFPGITACLHHPSHRFTGVVVTNGSGAPRTGPYAQTSDAELIRLRQEEQRQAAKLGQYAAVIQLAYPSATIRPTPCPSLIQELGKILEATRPQVVYLHNPADRHETHVAVLQASLAALRQLLPSARPREVYGCEVWGDLDWVSPSQVVRLPCQAPEDFGPSLLRCFRTQVEGGKRYDLAAAGRRKAQATFADAYTPDQSPEVVLAIDLLPLLQPKAPSLQKYVAGLIDGFKRETTQRMGRVSPEA